MVLCGSSRLSRVVACIGAAWHHQSCSPVRSRRGCFRQVPMFPFFIFCSFVSGVLLLAPVSQFHMSRYSRGDGQRDQGLAVFLVVVAGLNASQVSRGGSDNSSKVSAPDASVCVGRTRMVLKL